MAFPPILELVAPATIFLLQAPVVYFGSRALKLRPTAPTIPYPRKELNTVIFVVIALFIAVSILNIVERTVLAPYYQVSYPPFDPIDVLWWIAFYAVISPPMLLAMKRTTQGLASIGVSTKDGARLLILGLGMGMTQFTIALLLAPLVGRGLAAFTLATVYALVALTVGGFAEEIVWRGYIQTRLVAHSGMVKGLLGASLLFAFWHFPARYFQYGVDGGLASSVTFLPAGLIFGFVMLRARNIIPGSIFHVSWNLVAAVLFV